MRDDFCAFILTHGRPDRVYTFATLRAQGYTGKIFLVVDDEDRALPRYVEAFGADAVLVFSKAEIVKTFDEGDNFMDRRAIIYARNACFGLARRVGCRYFIQLDDDYSSFVHKFGERNQYGSWRIRSLDAVFSELLEYYISIPALSIAMSQAGDHIGGGRSSINWAIKTKRKAMNTLFCSVDRPFQFFGRINEDVNTYATLGRCGALFLSIYSVSVHQKQTQTNAGGMTELYLESGTYVKSFYTVMYCPSSVVVSDMGPSYHRIHHRIDWPTTAVKILREQHRKPRPTEMCPDEAPAMALA